MDITGFTFVEKPTDLLGLGDGAVLLDVSEMKDETSTVIYQYRDKLGLPDYVNDNWNSLSEALEDTSWMKGDRIVLVHEDLPRALRKDDLHILLKVLSRAAHVHRLPLEEEDTIRKKKVEFIVVFPTRVHQEIESVKD